MANHDQQHRREQPLSCHPHRQPGAVVVRSGGQQTAGTPQYAVLGGVRLNTLVTGEPHRGERQQSAEQVEGDREPVDWGRPDGDEPAAQHQCDDETGQQHPGLLGGGYREGGDDDHEREQIVHRQPVPGEVSGEELPGQLRTRPDARPTPNATASVA